MRDLVDATGVHRQTIHSYLRDGLLPGPCQGAGTRNARYSAAHVDLLLLLRELRDERGLSLDSIKRAFQRAEFDPEVARRSLQGGLPPTPFIRLEAERRLTAEQVAEEAGVDVSLVQVLVEDAVIATSASAPGEWLTAEAVDVARAAAALLEHGFSLERMVRVACTAARLASIEAQALVADATGATNDSEPVVGRAEERHLRVTALVSAVRLTAVHDVIRRIAEVKPRTLDFAHDAIYVPSALFIRRHALQAVVAEAEAQATRDGATPQDELRLGRLFLGLGRYPEAEHWLGRASQLNAALPDIWAYLGLSRALAGRIAKGVEACRRAVELAPTSARASAFLGAALALHAATTTGLAEATEVLRRALHEARVSRDKPARDAFELMEVLLARGRLFTVLPKGLKTPGEGEADLLEVLDRTEGARDEDNGFDFPGTNELYRVHALFYLGIAARDAGDGGRAAAYLRECITMDPTSRFAERAYELLGG